VLEYQTKHVSGPVIQPVTLTEVKMHLKLEPEDVIEDQLIASYMYGARIEAENFLDEKIGRQTWDLFTECWPYGALPIRPVISVDSVAYVDAAGVEQTVDPATYIFYPGSGRIFLRPGYSWPGTSTYPGSGIRTRVTAGIEPVSDGQSPPTPRYPDNIRVAILFRVGTFYRVREDVMLGTTRAASEVGTFKALLSGSKFVTP
jgi:uncharacterized phiE125 gp8 family phage protein